MIAFLSPLWILLFVLDIAAIAILALTLRKDEEKAARVLTIIAIVNLVYFAFYKIMLSRQTVVPFNWVNEMPLNLCNICSILIIFAIKTRKTFLMGFCYTFGLIGCFLALLAPDPDFTNVSFLTPMGYGFWPTHHCLLVMCISLVGTGLYKPKYSDYPKMLLFLAILYLSLYLVNVILRKLSGYPVNYMYTFGLPGNIIMDTMYRIFPIYPFYIMPIVIPLSPFAFLLMYIGRLVNRNKADAKV